jgi:hypothetical protein
VSIVEVGVSIGGIVRSFGLANQPISKLREFRTPYPHSRLSSPLTMHFSVRKVCNEEVNFALRRALSELDAGDWPMVVAG